MLKACVEERTDGAFPALALASCAPRTELHGKGLSQKRAPEAKDSPATDGAARPAALNVGERLLAITTALAEATSRAESARALLEHGVSALHAREAALWVQGRDSAELELFDVADAEDAARCSSIMVAPRAPVHDAIATGEPVWLESSAALAARYPDLASARNEMHDALSLVCVPLKVGAQVIGVLEVRFANEKPQDRDELHFLLVLGHHAALALERVRLDEEVALARVEAKQARADAAQAHSVADQAIRLRDDFLGIAGHELKTPLTVMKLGLQSLGKHISDNATVAKRLDACQMQLARLSRLSEELLDVSRINAHRLHLELDWMDLAPLVQEVIARMTDDLARAGCSLSFSVQGPVVGWWDRTRLDQVVGNLLSNATRYSKGKPIEVSLEATEEGARLSVRDHGIGIAPEDQARIFERFERAVSARHYGGLGLGLFIVRRTVESLGGRIKLASEIGRGSIFTVDLPRTPPECLTT